MSLLWDVDSDAALTPPLLLWLARSRLHTVSIYSPAGPHSSFLSSVAVGFQGTPPQLLHRGECWVAAGWPQGGPEANGEAESFHGASCLLLLQPSSQSSQIIAAKASEFPAAVAGAVFKIRRDSMKFVFGRSKRPTKKKKHNSGGLAPCQKNTASSLTSEDKGRRGAQTSWRAVRCKDIATGRSAQASLGSQHKLTSCLRVGFFFYHFLCTVCPAYQSLPGPRHHTGLTNW